MARALREMGLDIAVTPREYVAESLVEALGEQARDNAFCWREPRWRGTSSPTPWLAGAQQSSWLKPTGQSFPRNL